MQPANPETSTSFIGGIAFFVAIGATAAVLAIACLIAVVISCRKRHNHDIRLKTRSSSLLNGAPGYEMVSYDEVLCIDDRLNSSI